MDAPTLAEALYRAHRERLTGAVRMTAGGRASELLLEDGDLVGARMAFGFRTAAQALLLDGRLDYGSLDGLWARGEAGAPDDETLEHCEVDRQGLAELQLLANVRSLAERGGEVEVAACAISSRGPVKVAGPRAVRVAFESDDGALWYFRCPDVSACEAWIQSDEERAFLARFAEPAPLPEGTTAAQRGLLRVLRYEGKLEALSEADFQRRGADAAEARRALEAQEAGRAEEQRLALEAQEARRVEEQRLALEAQEARRVEEERLALEAEEARRAEEERLAREAQIAQERPLEVAPEEIVVDAAAAEAAAGPVPPLETAPQPGPEWVEAAPQEAERMRAARAEAQAAVVRDLEEALKRSGPSASEAWLSAEAAPQPDAAQALGVEPVPELSADAAEVIELAPDAAQSLGVEPVPELPDAAAEAIELAPDAAQFLEVEPVPELPVDAADVIELAPDAAQALGVEPVPELPAAAAGVIALAPDAAQPIAVEPAPELPAEVAQVIELAPAEVQPAVDPGVLSDPDKTPRPAWNSAVTAPYQIPPGGWDALLAGAPPPQVVSDWSEAVPAADPEWAGAAVEVEPPPATPDAAAPAPAQASAAPAAAQPSGVASAMGKFEGAEHDEADGFWTMSSPARSGPVLAGAGAPPPAAPDEGDLWRIVRSDAALEGSIDSSFEDALHRVDAHLEKLAGAPELAAVEPPAAAAAVEAAALGDADVDEATLADLEALFPLDEKELADPPSDPAEAGKLRRRRLLQKATENMGTLPRPGGAPGAAAPPSAADEQRRAAAIEARHQQLKAGADHFAVLGIDRAAGRDQVRAAFLELAKVFHPDRLSAALSALAPKATELFEAIRQAYDVLSDDAKRALYEQQAQKPAPAPAPAPAPPAPPQVANEAGDLFKRGEVSFKKRDFRAAESHFQRAYDLDNRAVYLAAKAWAIYMDPSRKAEAPQVMALLAAAVRADPQCDRAHYQLGVIARVEGDADRAERHFREAVRASPKHLEANQELRLIELRKKKGQPR